MAGAQDKEHSPQPKEETPGEIFDPHTLEITILNGFASLEAELSAAGILAGESATRFGEIKFSSPSFSQANLEQLSQVDRIVTMLEYATDSRTFTRKDTWIREIQAFGDGTIVSDVAPTWQDEIPSLRVGLFYAETDEHEQYNLNTGHTKLLEPHESLHVYEYGENDSVVRRVDITFLSDGSALVNFYHSGRQLGGKDQIHGFFPDGTRMNTDELQNAKKRIGYSDED